MSVRVSKPDQHIYHQDLLSQRERFPIYRILCIFSTVDNVAAGSLFMAALPPRSLQNATRRPLGFSTVSALCTHRRAQGSPSSRALGIGRRSYCTFHIHSPSSIQASADSISLRVRRSRSRGAASMSLGTFSTEPNSFSGSLQIFMDFADSNKASGGRCGTRKREGFQAAL